jgi:hypothetical protein
MAVKTFNDIRKEVGTRFQFACDMFRHIGLEYMILPNQNEDDYWVTEIINIEKDSAFVGVVSSFKSDDKIMDSVVIES